MGWAALVVIAAGIALSVVLGATGVLDSAAASFLAVAILVAAMLGLAAWDFLVALLAVRDAPYLALPERITLRMPRKAIPYLSPVAFLAGILVGHLYWP